jgi:subtilisin family serine protease
VICARNVEFEGAKAVSRLPHVIMVKLEPFVYPTLDVSARATKARESDTYSPNTAFDLGFTGEDVSIAILDSGVDDGGWAPGQKHDFLDDLDDDPVTNDANDRKRIAGVDFTQEESFLAPRDGSYDPDDTHGHGTHVAGIAMGTGGSDNQYVGIAPQARLVDVKVMENWGPLNSWGEVIAGVEWCIEHRSQYNIRVLSMSLGGGDSDGQDEGSQVVNKAVEAGLVVVVSIGNDGDPPPRGDGVADNSNEVPAPAAADHSISVGSVYDHETIQREDDTLSKFSFTGPRTDDGDEDKTDELKPDVVSYGEDIISAQYNTASGTSTKSGTSMSCPIVAGVVALMLQANSALTPSQVKEILHQSAEQRGTPSFPSLDSKYNTHYGWGIVDAFKAVEMARGFVEVGISIDKPQENDLIKGTTKIRGTAYIISGTGSVSEVEVSIDDPSFQTFTLKAEGTSIWSVDWDTRIWNGGRTIYARAKSGKYTATTSIVVEVRNEDGSGGDGGILEEDDSGKIELPFGIGKVSRLAAATFVAILVGIVVLIIVGVLIRRRRMYKRLLEERRAEQGMR